MRAVRATAPGVVETVEIEAPTGDGVRVRVTACGICGSDLHLADWGPLPATLGHEIAGVLDDGTPVVIEPNAPCGECDRCLAGLTHHCRTIVQRMYGVSLDGGLADEIIVAPGAVIPIPAGMVPQVAALAEPLAVAVHGLNRAGVVGGQRALVIGAGSIGLMAVAALRHRGVDIDLAARHPRQQVAGDALGATIRTGEDYDVVVDAAGTQSSIDLAMATARPGGSVLVLGSFWTPVQLDTAFGMREVSLVPSSTYGHHHGRREFLDAIDLLAADPEIADAVVSHQFTLDDAPQAFATAADRSAGSLKVLLTP